MFNIAKNRGINRTRHESVTMLQRYLNIFLLRDKIWSVYIETSITLSSGLKYMKSSMDSHKWAFQIKNIVQSRCAVLSFSDTGVDDLLTLDCFYCTVLTWLLQCKLLLLAFEVLLRFSHRKTGFCVFFFNDDNAVYTYITIFRSILIISSSASADVFCETSSRKRSTFCGVLRRQQCGKVFENSDLIYF